MRLDRLHLMIQAAMGWMNGHLHCFDISGVSFGMYDEEFGGDYEDESEHRLHDVVTAARQKFRYTYDFGDNWEHDVVVEKIVPPEPGVKYPRCTAGARACPPEDVGGPWGYANFLEAIGDSKHDQHDELAEWIGGSFDAEAFDVKKTDAALRVFKSMQMGMP